MSWIDKENYIKNKLLSYEEEVNTDALWEKLSSQKESKNRPYWLPLIIGFILGIGLTSIVAARIVSQKNNQIAILDSEVNDAKKDIIHCKESYLVLSKKQDVYDLERSIQEKKYEKRHYSSLNSHRVSDAMPNKLNDNKDLQVVDLSTKTNNKNEIILNINQDHLNEKEKHKNLNINYLSCKPILPVTLKYSTLFFLKLNFTQNKIKPLFRNDNTLFVSSYVGIPIVREQAIASDVITKEIFKPVISHSISFGMRKQLNKSISVSGSFSFNRSVSKLDYFSKVTEQITTKDTSSVTIDEVGNLNYEINDVSFTKISTTKGQAYNITNFIDFKASFNYKLMSRLTIKAGLGYNIWQSNKGINKANLAKFNNNDHILNYHFNYGAGLNYQLTRNLSLDLVSDFYQARYVIKKQAYERTNILPKIGLTYDLK